VVLVFHLTIFEAKKKIYIHIYKYTCSLNRSIVILIAFAIPQFLTHTRQKLVKMFFFSHVHEIYYVLRIKN
jgi:hypothetical protein